LKPNKKGLSSLKNTIDEYYSILPENSRELFKEECNRAIRRYKLLKPVLWKKWGKVVMTLIAILK
jgi:hypothetical protein